MVCLFAGGNVISRLICLFYWLRFCCVIVICLLLRGLTVCGGVACGEVCVGGGFSSVDYVLLVGACV